MAKILVTGFQGTLGRPLVAELRRQGHEVIGCDVTHDADKDAVRCDVRNYRQLANLFEANFDYVYHLAAEFGRRNGEDYYENLWMTNVVGTRHLLELQRRHHFRLIHFSSSEVYGDFQGVMSESVMDTTEVKQLNDYAMTKWVNEIQIQNAENESDVESVRLRLFNVYGPGELWTPYRGAVPAFIHAALHRLPYTVHLGHHRSFLYVDDAVRTFANVLDNFIPGRVYNVAHSQEWTIKELSDIILGCVGVDDSLVTYTDLQPFTTLQKRPDSELAREEIRHAPAVPLEEGIQKTVEWMRMAL